MRIFFALFACLVSVLPATAQTALQSFRPPMFTNVDVASKAVFFGWSVDCNTGRIPTGFMLWRTDLDGGNLTNVPVTVSTGPRPDVQSYFAAMRCNGGAMDVNLGWGLVPIVPEPPGTFIYRVLVTDVPNSWTCGANPDGSIWCDYQSNLVNVTVGDGG